MISLQIVYTYLPKGRWMVVDIQRREASRHISSSVHQEGDSSFSIYQISWIEMKKATFCKLKTSLRRNFIYNLQTFWWFCQLHFYYFVANSAENNFLPTSKHQQAKDSHFLGLCLYNCFIYCSNFIFWKCLEVRCYLGSDRKTVNSQGCSESREPIKTHRKCYSLIW